MQLPDIFFYGNPLNAWIAAAVTAAVAYAVLSVAKRLVTRKVRALAKKTEIRVDDIIAGLIAKTRFFFLLAIALYAGSYMLELSGKAAGLVEKAVVIAFLVQAAVWASTGVTLWIQEYSAKKAGAGTGKAANLAAVGFISRLAIWSVILLLGLDNIGIDVTALIAGLGISGIAVALAAQNILGDLFSSLSIVFDEPFAVGDFIIVGDFMGTVEHVGVKTTRLTSLSGEQLVFSNTDLVNSRIRNYQRMGERRIVFTLGVTYQTPSAKLEKIPFIIRDIIEAQAQTRFDRAHFKEFGDFALVFEVVYYVTTGDYTVYMDIQQDVNLKLFRRFEDEGIEFAYPTQTLFVAGTAGEAA